MCKALANQCELPLPPSLHDRCFGGSVTREAAAVDTASVVPAWPHEPPGEAQLVDNRVTLSWPSGESRTIAGVWLRDNCQCAHCRIEQTGEHRFFLGAVRELPNAIDARIDGGALSVEWKDGHCSRFAPEDFLRLLCIAQRSVTAPEVWADDFEPQRFDHDAVLADQATRSVMFEAAMRDGMVLITEMPNESGECIRFLEALAIPVRDTPFDRLHDVFFRADGYNVAHTDEPLPPHNDFASYRWPPSGQLIHMLVNDVDGGDWVNVDGFRVVEQLREARPDAVATLARVPIAFREHSDTAESWAREPLVRLDSNGVVTGVRFSNQLMQPMDPLSPDVEPFYEAYHLLTQEISDPKNQIEFRGTAGTMQLVNGHRILHARRGFDSSSGARHLQDTYFDFDDLTSRAAFEAASAH